MPSSVVSSMNYDADTHILRVFFVSGSVYDYKNVPLKVYEQMKQASSKGTFLNQVIKARFGFKKVK
jgi:hypothetical protein